MGQENLFDLTNDSTINDSIQPFMELITQIMELPEESLSDETIDVISGMISGAFTPRIKEDAINNVIKGFEEQNYTRAIAQETVDLIKDDIFSSIAKLTPSKHKEKLLNEVFNHFFGIFEEALTRYHTYSFELPIKLENGGRAPTYAHDTDACADIYASEDTTIPAHSLSNLVHTGLKIALPENWVLMLEPRSSIGFKSGLRLSNAMGIIDEEYRGEIGVLYDNFSDSDYEIKAGDRIAQCWIQPVYRFKPVEVVELPTTERGDGGFGSTGK